MKTIYVTITGTDFCCGLDFFRRHDALILKKEPKNEWDREAIAVYREGLGKVGYGRQQSQDRSWRKLQCWPPL